MKPTFLIFVFLYTVGQNQLSFAQDSILKSFQGEYSVEGGLRNSKAADFTTTLAGEANFEKGYNDHQLEIEIHIRNPITFQGKTYINYSSSHQRYEMFQIDATSHQKSTLFMLGKRKGDSLIFSSDELPNHVQWGMNPFQVIWCFSRKDNGVIVEEILLPDEEGEYFVQSYFKYFPR